MLRMVNSGFWEAPEAFVELLRLSALTVSMMGEEDMTTGGCWCVSRGEGSWGPEVAYLVLA